MELNCFKNIPQDISDYQNCSGNKCYFCKCDDNLYESVYKNKIINTCFLCNILINNKKEHVNMCLLGYSEKLTQLDIIQNTRSYYNTNGTIPFPQDLDSDVKLIDIPVYIFSQFKNKKMFNNYNVFFTSNVQNYMENEIKSAFSVSKKKEPIMKYYECDNYVFSDQELNLIETERNDIQKNNFSSIANAEKLLNKKIAQFV